MSQNACYRLHMAVELTVEAGYAIFNQVVVFVSLYCISIIYRYIINNNIPDSEGYRLRSQVFVDALMKKQVRDHIAMATGVRWVKLDRESITQSRSRPCCRWSCRLLNTCMERGFVLTNYSQTCVSGHLYSATNLS